MVMITPGVEVARFASVVSIGLLSVRGSPEAVSGL